MFSILGGRRLRRQDARRVEDRGAHAARGVHGAGTAVRGAGPQPRETSARYCVSAWKLAQV